MHSRFPAPITLLTTLLAIVLIGEIDLTEGKEQDLVARLEEPLCPVLSCDELPSTPNLLPAPERRPLLFFENKNFQIVGHLQAGLNLVQEYNVFWNFANLSSAGNDFDSDPEWLEAYLLPGLSFEHRLTSGVIGYGKMSSVLSGTLEKDAFDNGNTGRGTWEEGYIGVKSLDAGFDVSAGPRQLKLGSGMLIANGGVSGFERGALKLGPRKAWEFAGVARMEKQGVSSTIFYLDANELASNNTQTTLSGVDLRLDFPTGNYLGGTFIYIPTSNAPYPQAALGGIGAPSILTGAREALNTLDIYSRYAPEAAPNAFTTAEIAYQRNDRIDLEAFGWRVQIGYSFAQHSWKPTLTYSYQSFSGDDPNTSRLERFDPLYYEGSPSSWSTGSKSSMMFINSNVAAHQLALRFTPNPRNSFTLRYHHVRANELRSPIQFGQAARVDFADGISTVIAGVTDPHLSDDIFLEWSRIQNPNTYVTSGVSVAIPGAGIDAVDAVDTPAWPGWFVNVVVDY
ncbi:MAG: alginate export family protein [Aureliella sp.]